MANAKLRATRLYEDLDRLKASDACPLEIARIFDGLLAEVQPAAPNDPIISAMEAIADAEPPPSCGTVRAMVGQIAQVARGATPRPRRRRR